MSILTIEEIKAKVKPIAEKYGLKEVYLFGSYARGEADEKSDIDLVYATDKNTLEFYVVFDEFKKNIEISLQLPVSIISIDSMKKSRLPRLLEVKQNFEKERVALV
ncbi:nucleotidyltransferase domain-containing protein [Pseudolactococcus yaeyamensis]